MSRVEGSGTRVVSEKKSCTDAKIVSKVKQAILYLTFSLCPHRDPLSQDSRHDDG